MTRSGAGGRRWMQLEHGDGGGEGRNGVAHHLGDLVLHVLALHAGLPLNISHYSSQRRLGHDIINKSGLDPEL